jgi:hypothetical protein
MIPAHQVRFSGLSLPASCRQSMITDDARLAPAVIMDPRNMCGDDSMDGGF